MELQKRICPICGSSEVIEKGNSLFCCSCETSFDNPAHSKKKLSEDEMAKIASFESAEEYLRLAPPRFIEAEERYVRLMQTYPDSSRAIWGYLRSKYGIKYTADNDGKAIPICYKSKYEDIKKDPLFKKCVSLAESTEIKNKYLEEGDRISITSKEWEETASRHQYDIFLSFKQTDENGHETGDTNLMRELYTYLTEKRFKVFFSPVSMKEYIGKPYYDAYIFNALEKSQLLIVYGSKKEYYSAPWIESEWSRFLAQIASQEKKLDSLLVLFPKGINPTYDLPSKLAFRQNYCVDSRTLFPDVLDYVYSIYEEPFKEPVFKVKSKKDSLKKKEEGPVSKIEPIRGNDVKAFVGNKKSILKQVEAKEYSASNSTDIQLAIDFLRRGMYDKARYYFAKSYDANRTNPLILLGYIASLIESRDFYNSIRADKEIPTHKVVDVREAKELASYQRDRIVELLNISHSVMFANNVLTYLLCSINRLCRSGDSDCGRHVYSLFNIIDAYDSPIRKQARDSLLFYANELVTKTDTNTFEKIMKAALETYEEDEIDAYLDGYEKVINAFVEVGNLKRANKWSKAKLEHYQSDVPSVLRELYATTKVNTHKEFIKAHYKHKVANKVVKKLNKLFITLDKPSAEKIIEVLADISKELLSQLDKEKCTYNASIYINFISLYDTKTRSEFLSLENINKNYRDKLVDNLNISTIDAFAKALSMINEKDTIDYVYASSARARKARDFYNADKINNIGLKYAPTSSKLLVNSINCLIKYTDSNIDFVKWDNLTRKRLDNVLRECDMDSQVDVLEELLELLNKASSKTESTKRLTQILKCYDLAMNNISIEDQIRLVNLANKIANIAIKVGNFKLAKEYAYLSIENDIGFRFEAFRVLALAKNRARSDEELVLSPNLSEDQKEYQELMRSLGADTHKIRFYDSILDKNQNLRKHPFKRHQYRKKLKNQKKRSNAQYRKSFKRYVFSVPTIKIKANINWLYIIRRIFWVIFPIVIFAGCLVGYIYLWRNYSWFRGWWPMYLFITLLALIFSICLSAFVGAVSVYDSYGSNGVSYESYFNKEMFFFILKLFPALMIIGMIGMGIAAAYVFSGPALGLALIFPAVVVVVTILIITAIIMDA